MRTWLAGLAAAALIGCGGEAGHGDPGTASSGAVSSSGSSSTTGGAGGQGGSTTSAGGAGQGGSTTSAGGAPSQCPLPPAGVAVGLEIGDQLPEITVKD